MASKRLIITLFILGTFITSISVISLRSMHKGNVPPISLPTPTGLYAIGTSLYHFIDTARQDLHSENPHEKRELLIQMWYPAIPSNEPKKNYASFAEIKLFKEILSYRCGIPIEQFNYLDSLKTHSVLNAIPVCGNFPIIIFSTALGQPVFSYTSLLEELASHGYIVVGINHTYVSGITLFPNGRRIDMADFKKLIERWHKKDEQEVFDAEQDIGVADVNFVIEKLKQLNNNAQWSLHNHLDFGHVGIFGHSFGGTIAVQACRINKQFIAGINIDGKLHGPESEKGFATPFMFIRGQRKQQEQNLPIQRLWHHMTGPSFYIEIANAYHASFSDYFLLLSNTSCTKEVTPKLNPLRGITITRALLVDFFNRYLKNKGSFPPEKIKIDYPEIAIKGNL